MNRLRRAALALLLVWLVLPFVPLALWSVARGWRFPALLPPEPTLAPWATILAAGSGLAPALGASLGIATLTTILALAVGMPAGRALGLHRFRGKGLVELVLIAPVIVPGIAAALGLHTVFLQLGLANTLAGVVLVHLVPTVPYMVLATAAVYARFDPDLESQARSLGATPARAFLAVTLPAILPGLAAGALFAFLVSWSQYVTTLLVGGGRIVTLPMILFAQVQAGRHDLAGAMALVYVLPGVIAVILTGRHLSGAGTALAAGGGR